MEQLHARLVQLGDVGVELVERGLTLEYEVRSLAGLSEVAQSVGDGLGSAERYLEPLLLSAQDRGQAGVELVRLLGRALLREHPKDEGVRAVQPAPGVRRIEVGLLDCHLRRLLVLENGLGTRTWVLGLILGLDSEGSQGDEDEGGEQVMNLGHSTKRASVGRAYTSRPATGNTQVRDGAAPGPFPDSCIDRAGSGTLL